MARMVQAICKEWIKIINKRIKEFLKPEFKKIIIMSLFLLTFLGDICFVGKMATPLSSAGLEQELNLPLKGACEIFGGSPFALVYSLLIIIALPANVISINFLTMEIIKATFSTSAQVNIFTFVGIPLIIHLIYWYLLACLIFWIIKRYKKN